MSISFYFTEALLEKNGVLTLEGLPFKKGQKVEITVFSVKLSPEPLEDPFILRNEPLLDQAPFEPIATEDWEVLQ
jgi:hypothetical protein